MDVQRLGASFRALRRRRGWRQIDLSVASGVSRSAIGRVEVGELRRVPLGSVDRIAEALNARLDVQLRWNGEGLDRLLDESHARAVDAVVRMFGASAWLAAVEVSFAIGAERGSIDVLAFHPATGALAVIEVKSVVPDAGSTIHVLDRKARLARRIAGDRGWRATTVGRLLVIVDSRTARRRVADHADLFGAAFPVRGRQVTSWIRDPLVPLGDAGTVRELGEGRQGRGGVPRDPGPTADGVIRSGLYFLAISHEVGTRRVAARRGAKER